MERSAETPAFIVKVSPRRSLVRNGVLSYTLLSLPLFGALYFLSTSSAVLLTAIGVHVLSLVAAAAVYLRFTGVFIGVTSTAIYERSFLGRPRVMRISKIGHAVLVYTYRSSSIETMPQLLVRCVDHRRALRMRGTFWSEADMKAIATAIIATSGILLEERREPLTATTFFAEYPGSAYWFENRPALVAVAGFVALLVVLGVVLGFMTLIGIPIDRA